MGGKARPWVRSYFLLPQDLSQVGLIPRLCPSAQAPLPECGTWTRVGVLTLPRVPALEQWPVTDPEGAPRMDENRSRYRVRRGSTKGSHAVLRERRLLEMRGSKDLIRSHV